MLVRFGLMVAAFCWLVGGARPAAAQEDHYKAGGSGGLAYLKDPERSLGSAGSLGGFIGFRFNDNLSVEAGLSFSRYSRLFTAEGAPVEENTPAVAGMVFLTSTRYYLDATLVYSLGRRAQFHPFVLAGGGLVRREESEQPVDRQEDQQRLVEYKPLFSFGGGFEVYVLYNVSARVEARFLLPGDTERRTLRFLFGGTYYF